MHLSTLIGNVGFVFGALIALGLCGWCAVAPFRNDLRYSVLVAPLGGILVLVTGTLAGYVLLGVTLRQAALGAAMGVLILSVPSIAWPRQRSMYWEMARCLGVVLVVAVIAVWLNTAASIRFGGAALLFADGSDHAGYAHMADWLNSHIVNGRPVADPAREYESFPELLFQVDPRFGSFTFLALVAQASGHSGLFTYDIGTAIIAAATILAVAGVYARTRLTLLLLVVGLFTCHWFDYGRSGYFGKIIGYPSAFVVGGLFMAAAARTIRLVDLTALAALAAGGALVHSGAASAMFVGVIGGAYLVARTTLSLRVPSDRGLVGEKAAVVALALVIAVSLLSSGTLARPLMTVFPDWNLEWRYILPRIADLENQGAVVTGFSAPVLQNLSWALLGIGILGGLGAVVMRVPAAFALLLGPLFLLVALYYTNARAAAFQMIGTFYPLGLCGLAVLRDELSNRDRREAETSLWPRWAARIAIAFALVTIGVHLPRILGAAARFGGANTAALVSFSEQQMDALARKIGPETVDVDIPGSPQLNLALLVDLGRRGTRLQWSPASWRQILGYRPWGPPSYPRPGHYRLVLATQPVGPDNEIVLRTEQYLLLQRRPAGSP